MLTAAEAYKAIANLKNETNLDKPFNANEVRLILYSLDTETILQLDSLIAKDLQKAINIHQICLLQESEPLKTFHAATVLVTINEIAGIVNETTWDKDIQPFSCLEKIQHLTNRYLCIKAARESLILPDSCKEFDS